MPAAPASGRNIASPRAYVRKDGERFVIEVEKEKAAQARIGEVSQVALFGNAMLSTPALHECFRRNVPVTWHSYGGWFLGHTVGTGHHNVETRTHQYRVSFDAQTCLRLARGWVQAKISNCRTMLRRNWRGASRWEGDEPADRTSATSAAQSAEMPRELMIALREDMDRASSARSIESLLGIEGAAASRYFQNSDFIRAAGSCNLTDSGRKRFIAAFERRMTQEVTHPGIGLPVGCER